MYRFHNIFIILFCETIQYYIFLNKILVSKETAAAGRVKQKFGFIELVDKGQSDSEKGLWQLAKMWKSAFLIFHSGNLIWPLLTDLINPNQ